jgi:hypothetical protein
MTAYAGTLQSPLVFVARANHGSSDAAKTVDAIIAEGLEHYSEPRIESIVSEIVQIIAEAGGEGLARTVPVDWQTAGAAIQFARLLPWSLPTPEVAPEADGEISFDWLGPQNKMFSVSISRTGRIAYAGRFGERSKVHGVEQLSDTCPREVIQGISRAIG